ncbi:MAG: hypothetical protein ACRDNW_26770 [Trebonia sp.]
MGQGKGNPGSCGLAVIAARRTLVRAAGPGAVPAWHQAGLAAEVRQHDGAD